MPEYSFRNPKTGEIRTLFQRALAEHVYFDDDGLEWIREFDIPFAAIDSKLDPNDKSGFLDKTRKKNYNYGELSDISSELSKKRERERGVDPIREAKMKAYEAKTHKPHPERPKKTKWVI